MDILPDSTHKTAYTYDADNRVTEVKFDNSNTHKVNYTYDLLNRITNRTVTNGVPYATTYGFVDGDAASYGANATTPLISTITQGSGANAMNFAYTYDSRGNITSETRNGVTTTYEYDELCQLTRVNDPSDPIADSVNGTTWVFTYDRGGNILRKDAYSYTTGSVSGNGVFYWVYTYDSIWKDLLKTITKYNQSDVALIDNSNAALTYDAIGNPLSDGTWTYTWEKGRQLKSMHNASTGVTMEFKYNQNGIRTQKVKKVNGTVTETTDYILKGKYIASMKKNTDTYYFSYDASGKPTTVNFNGVNYTYVKNLQGDIVAILDASGNKAVEYKYDAWGDAVSIYSASLTSDPLAFDNPFRYRGYVWDEETGLYYLRNRYYNPKWGRFENTDSVCGFIGKLFSHATYVYCINSPVMRMDHNGKNSELVRDTNNPELDQLFRELYKELTGKEINYTDGSFTVTMEGSIKIDDDLANLHNNIVSQGVSLFSMGIGALLGSKLAMDMGFTQIASKVGASFVAGTAVDKASEIIQGIFVESFTVRPGTYTSLTGTYVNTTWYSSRTEHMEIRIYPDYLELWVSTASTYWGEEYVTPRTKVKTKVR